jgi:hypothetical protein
LGQGTHGKQTSFLETTFCTLPIAGNRISSCAKTKGKGVELDRAEARYRAHPDKGWSLTDCLSMEAMLDHGATEVATPDRHFALAGFRTLMSAPDVG